MHIVNEIDKIALLNEKYIQYTPLEYQHIMITKHMKILFLSIVK